MRREFDRHKEEEELIKQLRSVSQMNRCKINHDGLIQLFQYFSTKNRFWKQN